LPVIHLHQVHRRDLMLIEPRNQYAMRIHDHVIRVVVVAIDHVFIEAVEFPQDLRVHIYRLVGLDAHVSPLDYHHLLLVLLGCLSVFVQVLRDNVVVYLHIEEGDLV
jgi:hypothetical protein